MKRHPTILCRCEDIDDAAALAAWDRGARTARDLKLRTRIGMGACQGRTCSAAIPGVLRRPDVERLSTRPPVRPVRIDHILDHGDEAT